MPKKKELVKAVHMYPLPSRIDLAEKDYQKIAEVLGVPDISEPMRAMIKGHLLNYITMMADSSVEASQADRKNILEQLMLVSKELLKLINESLPVVIDVFLDADPEIANWDMSITTSNIYKVQMSAEKAIKILGSGRSGPKRSRLGLQYFIFRMAGIYSQISGKKPKIPTRNLSEDQYFGDFFSFIDICLKIINEGIQNSTLAAQISEVLKKWNNSPFLPPG